MKSEELFVRLVENALDFLFRSIDELGHYPKYSVIHFYAAVELFIKARLMSEHWSLVVTNRQEPDWEKFVAGDFQSVSLEESATKLKKAVRSELSELELQAFREVGKHRNKMVHFFHEAHLVTENNELRRTIAREQLRAWYILHQLLTVRWQDQFHTWSRQIGELDDRLRDHRKFLQVAFEHLKPHIEQREHEGFTYESCPSCGFKAQQHIPEMEETYSAVCLVCNFHDRCLTIECSSCGSSVRFKNEGFSTCPSCGNYFEPEQVVDVLRNEQAAYAAAMDDDYSWVEGNCSECDSVHTVVKVADNEHFCASCFKEFQSLQTCEWCDEYNTGDMELSYLTGCTICAGKLDWEANA